MPARRAVRPHPVSSRAVPLFAAVALGLWATLALAGACSERAPNALNRPSFLAFDAAGDLWVTDFMNHRLVRFSTEGTYLGSVGSQGLGPGQLWSAWGVVATSEGELAVVNHRLASLEAPGTFVREVKVLTPNGRERLRFEVLPAADAAPGWPEGIERVPEGWVVPDQERDALLFFAPDGRFLRAMHEIDGGPPLETPGNPRLSADKKTLWITEYAAHRVRALSLDGRQLLSVGREGSGPGEFYFPESIALSPEGWFVVADLGNYRLQRFDADGRHLGSIVPSPARAGIKVQLQDVLVGPDGLIWASDSKGGRVIALNTAGAVVHTIDHWEAP